MEEDLYLLKLVRYIHLNPLRAVFVEGLKALDTYPYCGHSALMGKGEQGFQDVDYVLNLGISKKTNIAPSTAIECVTRSRKIVDEKGLKLLGKGIESE